MIFRSFSLHIFYYDDFNTLCIEIYVYKFQEVCYPFTATSTKIYLFEHQRNCVEVHATYLLNKYYYLKYNEGMRGGLFVADMIEYLRYSPW